MEVEGNGKVKYGGVEKTEARVPEMNDFLKGCKLDRPPDGR
jgi:hypothetical protein